jgi:hypothetical protein
MGCGRLVVPDGHGPDRPAVDDHRAVVRREAAPDGRGRPWRDARAMLNGGAVGARTGARVRPTMRGDKRVFAAGSTHPRWYMESPLRHSIPRRVEVSAGTGGPAEAGRVRVHAGARSGRRPLRVVADEVVGCRRGPGGSVGPALSPLVSPFLGTQFRPARGSPRRKSAACVFSPAAAFLDFLSARFSLMDLPELLLADCRGDLSDMMHHSLPGGGYSTAPLLTRPDRPTGPRNGPPVELGALLPGLDAHANMPAVELPALFRFRSLAAAVEVTRAGPPSVEDTRDGVRSRLHPQPHGRRSIRGGCDLCSGVLSSGCRPHVRPRPPGRRSARPGLSSRTTQA